MPLDGQAPPSNIPESFAMLDLHQKGKAVTIYSNGTQEGFPSCFKLLAKSGSSAQRILGRFFNGDLLSPPSPPFLEMGCHSRKQDMGINGLLYVVIDPEL